MCSMYISADKYGWNMDDTDDTSVLAGSLTKNSHRKPNKPWTGRRSLSPQLGGCHSGCVCGGSFDLIYYIPHANHGGGIFTYLQNWVILFGHMLVNIPAPWSIWVDGEEISLIYHSSPSSNWGQHHGDLGTLSTSTSYHGSIWTLNINVVHPETL